MTTAETALILAGRLLVAAHGSLRAAEEAWHADPLQHARFMRLAIAHRRPTIPGQAWITLGPRPHMGTLHLLGRDPIPLPWCSPRELMRIAALA